MYETSKMRVPDLIYETTKTKSADPDTLDDDLVNFWAANLGDDGAPAMNRVRMYWLQLPFFWVNLIDEFVQ